MANSYVGKITVQINAKTDGLTKGINQANKSVDKFQNSARLTGIAISRVGGAIAGFGTMAAGTLATISAASTGALIGLANIASSYETAWTNVRKVLDGTEDELAHVNKGIRDMTKEIPMAAEEIAGIAESAARLGIKQEDILKFTRTVADLGVTTNMAADEAAESFARFANITGMAMDDVDRLGSTVVHLGLLLAPIHAKAV